MPPGNEGQDAAQQIRKRKDVEQTGEVADDRRLPADPATLEVGYAKAGQTLSEGRPEEAFQHDVIGHPQQRKPRPVNRRLGREGGVSAAAHRGGNSARDPGDTEGAVEDGVKERDDDRVGDQGENSARQHPPGGRGEADWIRDWSPG